MAVADEVDRYCAVLYREWEDGREEYRLKRVLNWFMGGEEKSKARRSCEHSRFKPLPGGGVKCADCGEVGY